MITRQTWILVLLTGGLFLYILAFESERLQDAPETIPAIFGLDDAQVQVLRLKVGHLGLEAEQVVHLQAVDDGHLCALLA